ncbi:hypothetical protein EV383_3992 [Pseudonocardia sediminis]|uniref:DUF3618 domain-containing protein n=1 Tax=Pseudonocardia sediminis TaxID=1397368 RepID=A0A4Q7UZ70_PSEST|nr:hypothetical protein [Pseudonocardia sediminis]RZT87085.1 hypothetical protein EV383_3992 [Pseudonocardia sediminis]
MAGRHSEEDVVVEDGHHVIDVTDLSPGEIRARVEDLQDDHVVQVEQARDDLSESIDRFVEGLAALRARLVAKARAAAPYAAGAAGVGVTTLLVVDARRSRTRRRQRRAERARRR